MDRREGRNKGKARWSGEGGRFALAVCSCLLVMAYQSALKFCVGLVASAPPRLKYLPLLIASNCLANEVNVSFCTSNAL